MHIAVAAHSLRKIPALFRFAGSCGFGGIVLSEVKEFFGAYEFTHTVL